MNSPSLIYFHIYPSRTSKHSCLLLVSMPRNLQATLVGISSQRYSSSRSSFLLWLISPVWTVRIYMHSCPLDRVRCNQRFIDIYTYVYMFVALRLLLGLIFLPHWNRKPSFPLTCICWLCFEASVRIWHEKKSSIRKGRACFCCFCMTEGFSNQCCTSSVQVKQVIQSCAHLYQSVIIVSRAYVGYFCNGTPRKKTCQRLWFFGSPRLFVFQLKFFIGWPQCKVLVFSLSVTAYQHNVEVDMCQVNEL